MQYNAVRFLTIHLRFVTSHPNNERNMIISPSIDKIARNVLNMEQEFHLGHHFCAPSTQLSQHFTYLYLNH